ncbi:MAG: hypothetical protein ACOYKN_12485 [Pirellula sp.]
MNDPDLEIVATKVVEMIWLRFQNRYAAASLFTSTPMSNTASTNRFFLSVGSEAPGPSSVFYYVNDEWMAAELCNLFKSEPGEAFDQQISYFMIDGNDISQLVLLQESVDELAIYTEPDLGVYDAKPSAWMLQKASCFSRAQRWESTLESLRKQKAAASKNQSSSEQSDSKVSDSGSGGSASSKERKNDTGSRATSASEQTLEDLLKEVPEEDCRNASHILLMLFAQAYYKMLEETTSISEWLTQMDMELNHSYLWTVQNLTSLLKNCPHLSDFPMKFEPIFEDLYPGTIEDVEWKLMVAPHAENFLSAVQKYTLKKGFYDPEEGSPAWIMVQLFRPGVDEAIERASNYNLRLRKLKQQILQKNSPSPKPNPSGGDSQSKKPTKPDDAVQNALKFGFVELDKCTWSDVAILFINSETVFVKIKEHSKRLVFSDFGMEQKNTRRPTVQWHLLYDFAREHGTLDWTSRRASQENRKRREKLSARLKDFFGIPGEPINKTADGKGWVTVFKCDES